MGFRDTGCYSYLQTLAAQSLASHPRNGQPESGRAPTPAPLSCARLEDKQQGELIGLYTSLENVTVKAERFLHEVIVTVLADKVVAREFRRTGGGVVEGDMSMPRRERAEGDEELRLDGGPNGAAMDEEVGMELVKLLVGAAPAQQLGDSGGEMAGGDRGLEGSKVKHAWPMGGDVQLIYR
jgi:hypothetical protein